MFMTGQQKDEPNTFQTLMGTNTVGKSLGGFSDNVSVEVTIQRSMGNCHTKVKV